LGEWRPFSRQSYSPFFISIKDNINKIIHVIVVRKKSVDITEEHEEWLEENAINFSKWVRGQLDEEMPE